MITINLKVGDRVCHTQTGAKGLVHALYEDESGKFVRVSWDHAQEPDKPRTPEASYTHVGYVKIIKE